ncbi:MAG: hypothetical protein AAGA18_06925 [Verrucomicrobiota bacterium]
MTEKQFLELHEGWIDKEHDHLQGNLDLNKPRYQSRYSCEALLTRPGDRHLEKHKIASKVMGCPAKNTMSILARGGNISSIQKDSSLALMIFMEKRTRKASLWELFAIQ